jgi:CDP-diacylglycerol--serine O-phosphatidyltransferase
MVRSSSPTTKPTSPSRRAPFSAVRDPVQALKWAAPSMLTIGALLCGLTAVRFSAEGRFGDCVKCIFFACVLDGLDGHTARALGTSSAIGFELDSLCDLANFGVCPALVLHFWLLRLPAESNDLATFLGCQYEGCSSMLEWAACCTHAACCALRLARFNVAGHAEQMDNQHLHSPKKMKPPLTSALIHNVLQRKMYFEGLPAPVAAAYAMFPIALSLSRLPAYFGSIGEAGAWAVGRRGTSVTLIITAVLMVSSVPTLSSKMLKSDSKDTHLQSRYRLTALLKPVLGVATLFAISTAPFESFLVMVTLHAISIPLGLGLYHMYAR